MMLLTNALKNTLVLHESADRDTAPVRDRSTGARPWHMRVWLPLAIGVAAAATWIAAWLTIAGAQPPGAPARVAEITWLGTVGFGLVLSALLATIVAFAQASAARATATPDAMPYLDDEPLMARSR